MISSLKMATQKFMVFLAVVLLMNVSSTAAVTCGSVTCTAGQGDCTNDGTSDVCYCRPEFMGPDCNTACAACPLAGEVCITSGCVPCSPVCDAAGGSCATVDNAAKCKCNLGYYGNECDQEYCSPNPCKNGGTCIPADGTCTCTPDWTGSICEIECPGGCTDLQQCMNNGGSPSCECKEGLTGTDCTTIACGADNAPCENEGTCADDVCTCTNNFAGSMCELECAPACGDNEQCEEVVGSDPECNDGVTAVVTPALIASLLMMLVLL